MLESSPALHALALAALTACSPARDPASRGARPDIVLVVIDTLRLDFLGLGGAAEETAPFLAELAGGSALFRHAFSTSSWTAPATASVFTGLYPPTHGVIEGFLVNRARRSAAGGPPLVLDLRALPASLPTLAERLRAAGYQTLGVASNVNVGPELGFDRGFERFHCARQAPAEELAATLLAWRAELDPERPSFFYVHLNDLHRPYDLRADWYSPDAGDDDERARYKSEIGHLDAVVRSLFQRMGWGPDTALVVVSDHGEGFGEHGLRGHGASLHGELNRILMIVRTPAWTGSGRVVEENVSLIDVRPTVLDLAGLADDGLSGAGAELAGRSLLPLLRGDAQASATLAGRTLFAHRGTQGRALWAAVQGPWKRIEDERTGRRMLFDVRADSLELDDRLTRASEVAERLARELGRFRAAALPLEEEQVRVELDETVLRHLSEIGYAEDD